MNEKETMEILSRCGAFIEGHFRLVSGDDSDVYVNKDAVYLNPKKVSCLAREIANKFAKEGIEVVAGPATGGAILASWTAYYLAQKSCREVAAVYADKDNGKFIIRRGYEKAVDGKKVLLVEDIINTGESAAKTAAAVEKAGGRVVAVAALFNRGGMTSLEDIPIKALVSKKLKSWDKEDCPLCKKGVPINTSLGHPPTK